MTASGDIRIEDESAIEPEKIEPQRIEPDKIEPDNIEPETPVGRLADRLDTMSLASTGSDRVDSVRVSVTRASAVLATLERITIAHQS